MSEKQINFEWQRRRLVHLHVRDTDAFRVKFNRKSVQRSICTKVMYKGESNVLDLMESFFKMQVESLLNCNTQFGNSFVERVTRIFTENFI